MQESRFYFENSTEFISLSTTDKSKLGVFGLYLIIFLPSDRMKSSLSFSFIGSLSLWSFSSHSMTRLCSIKYRSTRYLPKMYCLFKFKIPLYAFSINPIVWFSIHIPMFMHFMVSLCSTIYLLRKLNEFFKVYPCFCIHLDTKTWLAAISFTDEFHSSTNRD